MDIIWFLVVGLVVGGLARLALPGRDPMGLLGTLLLGAVGAFVGGFLLTLITTGELALVPAGWIGSVIGAVLVLLVARTSRRSAVV
jgi:uncharacterized membrane protein YeaQ/YmgE (transglycosylase-associated protein family)